MITRTSAHARIGCVPANDGFTGIGERAQQRLLFYPEMQLKIGPEIFGDPLPFCPGCLVVTLGSIVRPSCEHKRGMMILESPESPAARFIIEIAAGSRSAVIWCPP